MKLFEINTPEDLICRGYSREYILEKTGVDVGYNASAYRNQLLNVDRNKYKIDFIMRHVSAEKYDEALQIFAAGASKEEILNIFKISGKNIVKLNWLFSELGLSNSYEEADAKRRQIHMKEGFKNKYGTDNPFKMSKFTNKAVSTKSKNKLKYVPVSKSEVNERIYYDRGNMPDKYNASKIGMHDAIKNMLTDTFGESGFIENYSDERYPVGAKFYVPEKDLFIEYFLENQKTSMHWYAPKNAIDGYIINKAGQTRDPNPKTDAMLADEWKNSPKKELQDDFIEWTKTMKHKRSLARKHKLNYVVYWSNSGLDAFLHFDLGYPEAKDWEREGSYIPYVKIGSLVGVYPKPEKLAKGSSTNVKIAKYYQAEVFYAPDKDVWNANEVSKVGTTQLHLWANRRWYIGKRPHELSIPEILRGLNIMRKTISYTTYPNEGFTYVLDKYNVKSVADNCAGWLERCSTCAAYGIPYYGVDVNSALKPGYEAFLEDFNLTDQHIFIADSAKFNLKDYNADAVISCPPYFTREQYSNEPGAADSFKTYEEFLDWWSKSIEATVGKDTRIFAFQMHDYYDDKYSNTRYNLAEDMSKVVESKGWKFIEAVPVSLGRVSHMNRKKDGVVLKEDLERMIIFERISDSK